MSDDKAAGWDLNGIQEQDFQLWKHHPVTKLYVRYLIDLERQLAEKQIGEMRLVTQSPDPFRMGMFQGRINVVGELATIEFSNLVDFYSTEEEEPDAG